LCEIPWTVPLEVIISHILPVIRLQHGLHKRKIPPKNKGRGEVFSSVLILYKYIWKIYYIKDLRLKTGLGEALGWWCSAKTGFIGGKGKNASRELFIYHRPSFCKLFSLGLYLCLPRPLDTPTTWTPHRCSVWCWT
jgi:hypothetical protein